MCEPMLDPDDIHIVLKSAIQANDLNVKEVMPGCIWYLNNIELQVGIACTLKMDCYAGCAQGVTFIPGDFAVRSPVEYEVLPSQQAVNIVWSKAPYAEWYILDLRFSAYDSITYLGMRDTEYITTDTNLVIGADFFDYPNASYILATVSIYAYSESQPDSGLKGNITGDFNGFLFANTECKEDRHFYVGNPPSKSAENIKFPTSLNPQEYQIRFYERFYNNRYRN